MRAFHLVAAAALATLATACEGTNTARDGAMSAPSPASAPGPDAADSLDSPEPETTNPESTTPGPDLPEGAVDPIRQPEGT
jgi:hypothetical protein